MAGLYVHIPFCEAKCIYCDFYSMAKANHLIDKYIDALLTEAELRKKEINSAPLLTVYLGGGTPSLLNSAQLTKLIIGLRSVFDFSKVQEFTIEVNPDDVTSDYIKQAVSLGINRVSMGVQSFINRDLQFINRRHSAEEATEAIHTIYSSGINNISIDLIYGIPGQTFEDWTKNVDTALSLPIKHISAYSLMYEGGTRLSVMRSLAKIQEMSEEDVMAMYGYLVKNLKSNGYVHYEISNFALPGFQSRHNSNYWNLTPYLGLGAAAHSFDGAARRFNPSNLKLYLDSLSEGIPVVEKESITNEEKYDEYVMLRLRTSEGISTKDLLFRFGNEFYNHFIIKASPMVGTGNLVYEKGQIFIPEEHVLISDSIICELMWDI